jgi:hypothetical protein
MQPCDPIKPVRSHAELIEAELNGKDAALYKFRIWRIPQDDK